MRSLPKNLTSLEEIIWTIKGSPEIIALSERKLQKKNINNISTWPVMFSWRIIHQQVSWQVHWRHTGCLPELFDNMLQYASNIHCYNTG